MSIKVKGLNKVLRNLSRLSKNSEKAYKAALSDEADIIFGKSLRLVPIDEGILRSTGHVKAIGSRDKPGIKISYGGGPAKSYAVRQHEDMTLSHRSPQQAKFLEQPFREAQPGMTNRLANRIKKVL